MRMLVVGVGATGGYFGGRLAQAGRDVTFLVRPKRAAHLREHGLVIKSPYGDAALQPRLVTAPEIDGPYDVVLLTVKAYALEAAIDDLAPAVGPDTMILPVLNGMRHMDVLSARFGAQAVVGGVCKVAVTVDGEGRILHLLPLHRLSYGEMDGAPTPRVEALDAFMQGAVFDARLTPEVAREMWEKWLLLASLGGTTCLMRGNIGEIAAARGGKDFALAFVDEVVSIIKAAGVAPSAESIADAKAMLTAEGAPTTSSMFRDLQGGNAIEADQILGDLLARGAARGVTTPLVAAAYTTLAVYQNRRQAADRK